jgi:RNA polymerase sigma-70 factor (ECF subfamily)
MSKKWQLIDEQDLIEACIKGDGKAQRHLYDQYSGKMFGVCRRYCPELEDARDAMQTGFIKIFTILHKFKFNSKLETWMTRIMINTAIDQFKKSNKFQVYTTSETIMDLPDEIEVETNDENEISKEEILAVIDSLPHGYRLVFNLYAIDGSSHREIAQKLGISEGTSKSQLARARKLLQSKLKERGISG